MMFGRIIQTICFIVLLFSAIGMCTASSNAQISIQEIYSDIESSDFTLTSSETVEDIILEIQLERGGDTIDRKTIPIGSINANSKTITVANWDVDDTPDGAYQVKAQIFKNNEIIASSEYEFIHGRQILPEVIFEGMIADSEGISAVIKPIDASIVDVEYMLVDGNDVIYIATDEKISVHTTPLTVHKRWNTLLINNKEYSGRMKVRISESNSIVVNSDAFTSMDDAEITDIYKDEIGASATIIGNSQVPFDGYVSFTVNTENNGETILSAIMRSPVLLTEDDETVEAIWEDRLTEGRYMLSIEIIGNDGDILDVQETIIDVEKGVEIVEETTSDTSEENESPSFMVTSALLAIAVSAIALRKGLIKQ